MGCESDIDGMLMGCEWDIDGARMGFQFDISGVLMGCEWDIDRMLIYVNGFESKRGRTKGTQRGGRNL